MKCVLTPCGGSIVQATCWPATGFGAQLSGSKRTPLHKCVVVLDMYTHLLKSGNNSNAAKTQQQKGNNHNLIGCETDYVRGYL
eukprot:2510154-Amphidinium_carterae.1